MTLLGLAAKNAILIVEFASLKRAEGYSSSAAAIEAARLRFRPIIMTSLAFILGVVPLAFSTGAGAGARVSAGTGVMGGMLAATFLAIFFVPFFFKLITERKVREERSEQQLRAEVAEGEQRSAEHHRQLAAEAATHVHVGKGKTITTTPAHEGASNARPHGLVAATIVSLAACRTIETKLPPVELPETSVQSLPDVERWWTQFNDPQLNALD